MCFWNQDILPLIFFYWFRGPTPMLWLVLSCCYQNATSHYSVAGWHNKSETKAYYTGTSWWNQQSGFRSVLGDTVDTASLLSLVLEMQSSCTASLHLRLGYFCTIAQSWAQPHADISRLASGDRVSSCSVTTTDLRSGQADCLGTYPSPGTGLAARRLCYG